MGLILPETLLVVPHNSQPSSPRALRAFSASLLGYATTLYSHFTAWPWAFSWATPGCRGKRTSPITNNAITAGTRRYFVFIANPPEGRHTRKPTRAGQPDGAAAFSL